MDEEGNPVAGARVGVGVVGGVTKAPQNTRGQSDTRGIFIGEITGLYAPGFNVNKEGYYGFQDSILAVTKTDGIVQRWEPSTPTVVATLRPIVNPIPMYARYVSRRIPALNRPYGFDLEVGDYVAPDGRGVKADVYFTITGGLVQETPIGITKTTLQITFPNRGDGLTEHLEDPDRGSAFKLPRYAPEAGYVQTWTEVYGGLGPNVNWKRNGSQNYIFRIHTVLNDDGTVRSALYGKIRGHFTYQYRPGGESDLLFTYYLNPDGSRNLEFDPTRNLFQGRKDIPDRDLAVAP